MPCDCNKTVPGKPVQRSSVSTRVGAGTYTPSDARTLAGAAFAKEGISVVDALCLALIDAREKQRLAEEALDELEEEHNQLLESLEGSYTEVDNDDEGVS